MQARTCCHVKKVSRKKIAVLQDYMLSNININRKMSTYTDRWHFKTHHENMFFVASTEQQHKKKSNFNDALRKTHFSSSDMLAMSRRHFHHLPSSSHAHRLINFIPETLHRPKRLPLSQHDNVMHNFVFSVTHDANIIFLSSTFITTLLIFFYLFGFFVAHRLFSCYFYFR